MTMLLLVAVGHILGIVVLHETVRKCTMSGPSKGAQICLQHPTMDGCRSLATHSMFDCNLPGCNLQRYILLAGTDCNLAGRTVDRLHTADLLVVVGSSFGILLGRNHLRIAGSFDLVGRFVHLAGKCSRRVEMNLLVGCSSSFALSVLKDCPLAQQDRLPMN